MAVALVVEDGTGLTAANSYLTIAEATDILCLNAISMATWTAFDTATKERLLIWASDYIDCYVDWKGTKTVSTSGLRWPRECVTDLDGVAIANNVVPSKLKNAVAQLAIFLNTSAAAASGGNSSAIPEGIKRVKADVVEVEFFEDGSSDSKSGSDLLPVNMSALIRGLGSTVTGRQRFVPAVR